MLQDAAPPETFARQTAPKLAAFRAAAGSILFYQDTDVVLDLQQRMPLYADTCPVSADKEFAMMQYAIWTTFAAARIGANIQHYNPLIDEAVAQTWQVPAHWRLRLPHPKKAACTRIKDSGSLKTRFPKEDEFLRS